jgi:hypothetical protein
MCVDVGRLGDEPTINAIPGSSAKLDLYFRLKLL